MDCEGDSLWVMFKLIVKLCSMSCHKPEEESSGGKPTITDNKLSNVLVSSNYKNERHNGIEKAKPRFDLVPTESKEGTGTGNVRMTQLWAQNRLISLFCLQ